MFGIEYRPLTFKEIHGLDIVKKILISNLRNKKYASGYIFEGPYSSGKTTISRVFARSILCENPQEDMSPCNVCSSCTAFLQNRHPGYVEIDAANNGTKDRIQDIKEMLQYGSMIEVDRRIILFDEAHNISKEGKDALLLQLEQIDPSVVLIFCTTESNKMPDTIKSRCYLFNLPEPREQDIVKKLEYICNSINVSYEEEALYKIVRSVGRHYRDAENKLAMILSYTNSITLDNVKSMLDMYEEEIVDLFLYLPDNLSAVIDASEFLLNKMDSKQLYQALIKVLVDAIKRSKGYNFNSNYYNCLLDKLISKYDNMIYEILNFIFSKNAVDKVMVQSVLILMHHKFIKGEFNSNISSNTYKNNTANVDSNVKKENKVEDYKEKIKDIMTNGEVEPWERDTIFREYKLKKESETVDDKVEERVSNTWGIHSVNIDNKIIDKNIKVPLELFKKIVSENNERFWI